MALTARLDKQDNECEHDITAVAGKSTSIDTPIELIELWVPVGESDQFENRVQSVEANSSICTVCYISDMAIISARHP
jgi:hypothetical protein